jgi:hypothetical protein
VRQTASCCFWVKHLYQRMVPPHPVTVESASAIRSPHGEPGSGVANRPSPLAARHHPSASRFPPPTTGQDTRTRRLRVADVGQRPRTSAAGSPRSSVARGPAAGSVRRRQVQPSRRSCPRSGLPIKPVAGRIGAEAVRVDRGRAEVIQWSGRTSRPPRQPPSQPPPHPGHLLARTRSTELAHTVPPPSCGPGVRQTAPTRPSRPPGFWVRARRSSPATLCRLPRLRRAGRRAHVLVGTQRLRVRACHRVPVVPTGVYGASRPGTDDRTRQSPWLVNQPVRQLHRGQ